jgi:acetyl-CoA carboxylase carboxyl transferase subunit alpha
VADEDAFERPIEELEQQIDQLSSFSDEKSQAEVEKLRGRLAKMRREVYAKLSPWQKTLVARHPRRPYTLDYIGRLFQDWTEMHGDRKFADDPAIVSGFATLDGRPVAVIGHQKGRDTKEKIRRNFGMPRPEGYRKALRIMELAEKFGRPILTFVDTPGAYPGIGAEERGQAEAIAVNLREMARLDVPVIVTVTGEGGSGGALALGVGDRVNMMEYAIYSVISPEGCAAILWRDAGRAREAAKNLRLTAPDLRELGLIDEVIPEPSGGAHSDPELAAERVGEVLRRQLEDLADQAPEERKDERYAKLRRMGRFSEVV